MPKSAISPWGIAVRRDIGCGKKTRGSEGDVFGAACAMVAR